MTVAGVKAYQYFFLMMFAVLVAILLSEWISTRYLIQAGE